jgi:hypothetical protein
MGWKTFPNGLRNGFNLKTPPKPPMPEPGPAPRKRR